jgi:hypothetical protein
MLTPDQHQEIRGGKAAGVSIRQFAGDCEIHAQRKSPIPGLCILRRRD